MKKRILSILMVVCMVVTMMSPTALAEASAQAQWGLAGADGSLPSSWTSGTLAEAMTYANGQSEGTAYIQLLTNIDKGNHTTWPLVFETGKSAILDLYGRNIDRGLTAVTSSGNVITVNGTLTLKDTNTNIVTSQGVITGGYNSSSSGGGALVNGTGKLIMQGGNIAGNKNTASSQGGGGVLVWSGGNFDMQGGSIANNEALYWGGGVYSNGSFTMTGGSITGNRSVNGGVFFQSNDLKVGGTVVIDDNWTTGTPAVERNVVRLTSNISVTTPLATGAHIGVTAYTVPTSNSPVDITNKNTADYSSYFFSDNSNYAIINSGTGANQIVQLVGPANLSALSLSSGSLSPFLFN
jgi:hypothetical protein